jgi:hypothetical protein
MKDLSFSQRLKAGWSKADLMRYYALDEKQYDKVLASLQGIANNRDG